MKSAGNIRIILLAIMFIFAFSVSCDDDDDDDDSASPDDDDTTDDDDDITDDDDDTFDDDDDDDDTCLPGQYTGYTETDDNGITWSTIPAGCFIMGSPEDELGYDEDEVQHEVILSFDFAMSVSEITQSQFFEMMGYNQSRFPMGGTSPDRPVETVSWYDAVAYANKLSDEQGFELCYTFADIVCWDESAGDTDDFCKDNGGIYSATVGINGVDSVYACEGYRLPTESEWEYAARAGTDTAFPTGDVSVDGCWPVDPNLKKYAWYCGNAHKVTHKVMDRDPNQWGLYDMAGNVFEWTWDFYNGQYPASATDPEGPEDGHFRTARGGSIRFYGANRCRSAYRSAFHPSYQSWYGGFRLVRTLTPDKDKKATPFIPMLVKQIDYVAEMKSAADYPDELPFTFTRTDVGTPLTQQEIDDFTEKITSYWKNTGYFDWIKWISHGMDPSNGQGYRDYKLYFQDYHVEKSGNVVTFVHDGNADNLMIRTGKIFNNVAALYLASGDQEMAHLVEQYSKGVVALIDGLLWTDQDPEGFIMPRTIFTQNHTYTQDGRQTDVTYDGSKQYRRDWNGHTFPNPVNPYWGSIWIRSMRSKDDVPHIYRMVPMLMRVVEDGQDAWVVEAAAQALYYLQGFARDIVDSGYYIRTKDDWGNTHVPLHKDGWLVNDLASFEMYTPLIPNAECDPRLASAMIAYGEPLDVDCGSGFGNLYEPIAQSIHYFNAAIIRYFHVAAATTTLMAGHADIAEELVHGLADRTELIKNETWNFNDDNAYQSDRASFLLATATAGVPLTSEEARYIVDEYSRAVDHFETWEHYDFWDVSVPDGSYSYQPSRNVSGEPNVVRITEMGYLLEYCYTPFRNDTGAELVDCDVILDPTQW